jgi:hypothetical protein
MVNNVGVYAGLPTLAATVRLPKGDDPDEDLPAVHVGCGETATAVAVATVGNQVGAGRSLSRQDLGASGAELTTSTDEKETEILEKRSLLNFSNPPYYF